MADGQSRRRPIPGLEETYFTLAEKVTGTDFRN